MKILKLLLLFGITLTFTFCSIINDEDSEDEDPYIEVVNEQEQTVLDPNQVFNKIVIEGATIINEAPPTPNGAISYSLISTSTATIDEGFDITFNTTENIAGAYLLISDEDGNLASSYFDIPESAFGSLQSNNTNRLQSIFNTPTNNERNSGGEDINITINNFLESLSNGVFCYQLCVYDSNGNISLPQTQCVTIETLGGNEFLVDRWYLNRYEEYGNGESINVGMNEEYCNSELLTCNNGNTITLTYCSTFITFYMDLFVDGTYRLYLEENNSDYDWEASSESCTQVYRPDYLSKYDSEGIWAYNESNGKLFMAEYFYRSNYDGEVYEEFYEAGNAQLLFDTPININGNSFVLDVSEPEVGYQVKYTFNK